MGDVPLTLGGRGVWARKTIISPLAAMMVSWSWASSRTSSPASTAWAKPEGSLAW